MQDMIGCVRGIGLEVSLIQISSLLSLKLRKLFLVFLSQREGGDEGGGVSLFQSEVDDDNDKRKFPTGVGFCHVTNGQR